MTIKECIDIVDNIKPNQYTIKDKVMWLSFIDEIIINEVLRTHEGYDGRYDLFEGYTEDKLSVTLIVPSPYDRLYTAYIKMQIDKENGETARYNNSMMLYNTYMQEYRKHYNKTHMPLDTTTRSMNMKPSVKPSPGLTDAELENIKKDLTFILTEYFSDTVSPDKLNDAINTYLQNNIGAFKGKDGYTPKKGVDYWNEEDIAEIKAYVDKLGGEIEGNTKRFAQDVASAVGTSCNNYTDSKAEETLDKAKKEADKIAKLWDNTVEITLRRELNDAKKGAKDYTDEKVGDLVGIHPFTVDTSGGYTMTELQGIDAEKLRFVKFTLESDPLSTIGRYFSFGFADSTNNQFFIDVDAEYLSGSNVMFDLTDKAIYRLYEDGTKESIEVKDTSDSVEEFFANIRNIKMCCLFTPERPNVKAEFGVLFDSARDYTDASIQSAIVDSWEVAL